MSTNNTFLAIFLASKTPSNESLELSFQRGSPDEDAGGNRGLESLDR